jgi:uncharacterized integral membrane protein
MLAVRTLFLNWKCVAFPFHSSRKFSKAPILSIKEFSASCVIRIATLYTVQKVVQGRCSNTCMRFIAYLPILQRKKWYNFLGLSVLHVCTSRLPWYLQPLSNCNSDCIILEDSCTWRVSSFMYGTQTVLSSTMQPIGKETYWVLFNAWWKTRWICLECPLLLHVMIKVIAIHSVFCCHVKYMFWSVWNVPYSVH